MKRLLRVGDIVRITAKNRKYSSCDHEVRIVEVSEKMAKGKEVFKDGSLSMCGYHRFNKNYDTKDLEAKPYGKDPFNSWNRTIIPIYEEVWRECWRYKDYEVSTLGNVRNKKSGRILKVTLSAHKKPQVNLTLFKDWRERVGVAQLVYKTFMPKETVEGKEKLLVKHNDNDNLNNSFVNLYA